MYTVKQITRSALHFIWFWRGLWLLMFVAAIMFAVAFARPGYKPYDTRGEALLATEIHDLRLEVKALRTEIAGRKEGK